MTHQKLVQLARLWLIKARQCSVVLCEKVSPMGESPDAIGWRNGRHSILIECKVSLADFRRDRDKWFRHDSAGVGLGQQRFFMAPPGVIPRSELPEGWGLLEVTGNTVRTTLELPLLYIDDRRAAAEVPLLVQCLRQSQIKLAGKERKARKRPWRASRRIGG